MRLVLSVEFLFSMPMGITASGFSGRASPDFLEGLAALERWL